MKSFVALQVLLCMVAFITAEEISKRSTRACVVEDRHYLEGESFLINVPQGCSFNCTCMIHGDKGIGNCSKQCDPFEYPVGCEPQREDGPCGCYVSSICPPTCQDEDGVSYNDGDSFTNDTCECSCIKGTLQCQCQREEEVPNRFNTGPCIPDGNITCKICLPNDEGEDECETRQKCEQWPFSIMNKIFNRIIGMTCTCYGPRNFTKCVPNIPPRQKRLAINKALYSDITFHSLERETAIIPGFTSNAIINVPSK